jgi:hypothetical protein
MLPGRDTYASGKFSLPSREFLCLSPGSKVKYSIPEIFPARKSLIMDIPDSRLGWGSLINIFYSVDVLYLTVQQKPTDLKD